MVACWIYTVDLAATYMGAGLFSSSANTHWATLNTTLTGIQFSAQAGGVQSDALSGITPVAGQWYYLIGRAVSATSRWIIVYDPSHGQVDQVQDVTSVAPTFTTPRLGLGGLTGSTLTNPSNDIIAEFFYMDADFAGIATGAVLPGQALTRKLALEGPFSCGEIIPNIVEYRALLSSMDVVGQSDQVSTGLVYSRVGLTTWGNPFTAANIPTAGPHPPLSTNYVRPGQIRPILTV